MEIYHEHWIWYEIVNYVLKLVNFKGKHANIAYWVYIVKCLFNRDGMTSNEAGCWKLSCNTVENSENHIFEKTCT